MSRSPVLEGRRLNSSKLAGIILSSALCMVLLTPAVGLAERTFAEEFPASDPPLGATVHGTYNSGQRNVAVRNDTVHIMWSGNGVWYSRSIDGGATFGPDTEVDTAVVFGAAISLCVGNDGTIYAVWYDVREEDGSGDNIYFTKSIDGGDSFGPVVRVDDTGTDPSWQMWPAVAVDDVGRIYVVWLDDAGNGGDGVYVTRSVDGGASFEPSIELSNPGGYMYRQSGPSIAARGDGEVYVACFDEFYYEPENEFTLGLRRSTDAGQSYSAPVYVGESTYSPVSSSLALSGSSDVYVAWTASYAYMARSDDAGQSFGPAVQVSDDYACCIGPERRISISVTSYGWVGVAWRHESGTVAFRESGDGGNTFFPEVFFVGTAFRGGASLAMDDSLYAYLLWTDDKHHANGDIYFTKGMRSPVSGVDVAEGDGLSKPTHLHVWPNPFRTSMVAKAEPSESDVRFTVYDPRGRIVTELEGGSGSAIWDGRDRRGDLVAPGVYIVRLQDGTSAASAKVVFSK